MNTPAPEQSPSSRNTPGDPSGYFLFHSVGIYPGKERDMAEALSRFAAGFASADTGHWKRVLPLRQAFLNAWAALINAPAQSVTSAENVTAALYSLIGSLPSRYLVGRQVLIAADCFPSLHFLLNGLQQRYGFTLVTVPIREHEHWVHEQDVIDRWSADVGLALLTWVTSTSSHRSDLSALVEHGQAHDTVIGVDITQAVGLLPFDVEQPKVDFVVSTSLKWLCGAPGAGILQVSPTLLENCLPEFRGWFSQDNIFSWHLDSFAYAPDARRFDNGTPSMLACVGSLPALEWHNTQNPATLITHNRELCAQIINGIARQGLQLVSPSNPDQRGGSLMIRLDSEVAATTAVKALAERDIAVDHRGQTLRCSPGGVSTAAGVDRLLAGLASVLSPCRAR